MESHSGGVASTSMVAEGSAHGRFQPFHRAHTEYVLAAKKRCTYLWIGITKYDIAPESLNPLGRPRERPEANPLTFFERQVMIRRALVAEGLRDAEFGFVPFPIETPSHLTAFMPTQVKCFTTVCEPWNEEKIEVLRGAGYDVEVLWRSATKEITGSAIRASLVKGDGVWRKWVTESVAAYIDDVGLAARLQSMQSAE